MISASNVKYFKKRPLIPKSLLRKKRDCIIVGSACEQGEVYQAILDDVDEDKLEEIASFTTILKFSQTVITLLCSERVIRNTLLISVARKRKIAIGK